MSKLQSVLVICFFAVGNICPQEIDRFSACQQIKQLPLDATPEQYRAAAQDLAEHGLSTCQCITHLVDLKEIKKQQALASDLGLPTVWSEVQARMDCINEISKPSTNPTLQFDERAQKGLFPAEQELIRTVFNQHAQHSVTVKAESDGWSDAAAKQDFTPSAGIKNILIIFRVYNDPEKQKGVLLHEFTHFARQDSLKKRVLHVMLTNKIKGEITDEALDSTQALLDKNSFYNGWRRAYEGAADRIPAACGSCEDAYAIKKYCSYTFLDKCLNSSYSPLTDRTHPYPYKRDLWATRILGLKKAEEQMAKDGTLEQIQKKRAKQPERTLPKTPSDHPFHAMNLFC